MNTSIGLYSLVTTEARSLKMHAFFNRIRSIYSFVSFRLKANNDHKALFEKKFLSLCFIIQTPNLHSIHLILLSLLISNCRKIKNIKMASEETYEEFKQTFSEKFEIKYQRSKHAHFICQECNNASKNRPERLSYVLLCECSIKDHPYAPLGKKTFQSLSEYGLNFCMLN